MYIQNYTRKKKSGEYQTTYIAESYRENGKVKRRHLCNLTHLDPIAKLAICNAINGLKDKKLSLNQLEPLQGKSCGSLLAFKHLAEVCGISKALGTSKQAKLALFQIIARIVCQGSRLYSTQWSTTQAVNEVLGLNYFNEDDLYANLDWLTKNQEAIESKLFKFRHKNKSVSEIYLYDVTSSYLEGNKNELGAYGYNRDKKRGKMQIVIGLMCDNEGYPVSVQVFEGNTSDSVTVHDQIEKLAHKFKVDKIVLVGDRGMIKQSSIEELNALNWYYITAITKAQINTLLDEKVIQLELFSDKIIEIENDGIRYILHRNPLRFKELQLNKISKYQSLERLCSKLNNYLYEHPRAKVEKALEKINEKAAKLKINKWVETKVNERTITVEINQDILDEASILDGCYVIKSNVTKQMADSEFIHKKYKDLAMVEQAFRTFKLSIEEIRPIYVRKASRTRGHVFICMLAYMLVKKMSEMCAELKLSRQIIIDNLNSLQYIRYKEKNIELKILPKTLQPNLASITEKLNLKLPSYL